MQKHLFSLLWLLSALSLPFSLLAQNKPRPEVTIPKIPASTDEFVRLRNQIATTPEGGAAMFVLALHLYTKNPVMGMECIITAVDMSVLQASSSGYKGYDLGKSSKELIASQLKKAPHLPLSYYKGTSPNQGYKLPSSYVVETYTNPYSGDEASGAIKLFVKSTGADSPRPLALKKNDKGIWKANEWSSLLVGVRKPASNVKDDL